LANQTDDELTLKLDQTSTAHHSGNMFVSVLPELFALEEEGISRQPEVSALQTRADNRETLASARCLDQRTTQTQISRIVRKPIGVQVNQSINESIEQ
jgi:hypothetical protein